MRLVTRGPFSTLAESIKLPESHLLQHCMDSECFAGKIRSLDSDLACDHPQPVFRLADIKAFAYESGQPSTSATEPVLETPQKKATSQIPTVVDEGNLAHWGFSEEAGRLAFAIRSGKVSFSSPSSSCPPAEPSPSKSSSAETSKTETHETPRASKSEPLQEPCEDQSNEPEQQETSQDPFQDRADPKEICEDHDPDQWEPLPEPFRSDTQDPCEHTSQKVTPDFATLSSIDSLLCIGQPWCGLVAAGEKTWELRSFPTTKRRLICNRLAFCNKTKLMKTNMGENQVVKDQQVDRMNV